MPSKRTDSRPVYVYLLLLALACAGIAPSTLAAPSSQALSAPTRLQATATSEFEIDLAWTDHGATQDGYKVERTDAGGIFRQIAQVSRDTVRYRDDNLFPNTQYRYRVRSYNAFGDSTYSNQTEARTFNPTCPILVSTFQEWFNAVNVQPDNLQNIVAVAEGGYHTLALKNTGQVVAWGENSYGQSTPPTNLDSVVAIACGSSHSLALKGDGSVVAWGWNTYGQASIPANLTGVTAIAGGGLHSLALRNDGTVVGWGDNSNGQVTPPAGLKSVVAISAGNFHSLALRSDGTVVGWGDNSYGQSTPPTNLTGVVAISAGIAHSLALKKNGTVVGWGYPGPATVPTNLTGVVAIAGGGPYSLALKSDGTVVGWSPPEYTSMIEGALMISHAVAISACGYRTAVLATSPTIPEPVTPKIVSKNRIDISWRDNSDGDAGFRIQRAPDEGWTGPGRWQQLATLPAGVTNYPDRTATTNVTYWYRVQAFSHCGDSPFSFPVSARIALPTAPYIYQAIPGLSNSVDLSIWPDSATDGLKIERAPDVNGAPGRWTEIATTGLTNAFSDFNVRANTTYWYRTRAFNQFGYSDYSNSASVTTSPPSAPTSLQAVAQASSARLRWQEDPAPNLPQSFLIDRAPDDGGVPGTWSEIASITNVSMTSWTDTKLAANTIYWYRIRARNWAGEAASEVAFVVILPPIAPVQLIATIGPSNGVSLSWKDNLGEQDGFKVERAPDNGGTPGSWSEIATLNDTNAYTAAYFDSPLNAHAAYWYRVRAFNSLGLSPYSDVKSIELKPPEIPESVAYSYNGQAYINWTESTKGPVGYRIFRAPDVDGNPGAWTLLVTFSPADSAPSPYIDLSLPPGVSFWYALQAFNWIGDSSLSAPTLTWTAPPEQINSLYATPGVSNQISLLWYDYHYDQTGFEIERAADAAGVPGTWLEIATNSSGTGTDFSYSDSAVTNNGPFWYRVRAYNPAGFSPYSPPVQAQFNPPSTPEVWPTALANRVTLELFDADFNTVDAYQIERAPDMAGAPGTWNLIGSTSGDSYTDTVAPTNAIYWYRVQAQSWTGVSDYSDPATVEIVSPSAPYFLTAGVGTKKRVDLTWTTPSPDQDGFILDRAPDAGGKPAKWTKIAVINDTNSVCMTADTKAAPNQTYWYRLRAFNKIGVSPFSDPIEVSVAAPNIPSLNWATPFNDKINLDWSDDFAGSLDGYYVERAPDVAGHPGPWKRIMTTTSTEVSDTPPKAGTAYWYRVRAFNWVGTSLYSDSLQAMLQPPSAPTSLQLSLGNTNEVNLQWLAIEGQPRFSIERAPDDRGSPGIWNQIGTSTNDYADDPYVNFTDHVAVAGVTYWYRVRAVDLSGFSDYTPPASINLVPPGQPQITETLGLTTVVELGWYNLATNATGYSVERAPDIAGAPGLWKQIAQVAAPSYYFAGYRDEAVLANNFYWYRLRAYNWTGSSAPSPALRVSTAPPPPPFNLTATNDGPHQVTITWQNTNDDVEAFYVQRARDAAGAPGPWTDWILAFQTIATDRYVTSGQTYWYRVYSSGRAGNSPYSNAASVTVAPDVIPAPPRIISVVRTNDDLLVTWQAPGGSTNILQSASALGGAYSDSSPPLIIPGAGTVSTSFPDPGAATNSSARFYRIRLAP